MPTDVADGRARKVKRAKPPELDGPAWVLLTSILFRIACSARWAWDLRHAIDAGWLPYRPERADAQERALRNTGAYPPGGEQTRMVRCNCCRKWIPPQAVGSSG